MSLIRTHSGVHPKIAETAWLAETAVVIGDVAIGPNSSIWYGCVLRGDVNFIRVGARTNIQDGTIVHVARGRYPTHIGDDITIGHGAIIHACSLENGCFIGMQACIMDGAVVESGAMVAAGALVPPGKRIPAGTLWAGRPARHMRALTPDDLDHFAESSAHYARLAAAYAAETGCPA